MKTPQSFVVISVNFSGYKKNTNQNKRLLKMRFKS